MNLNRTVLAIQLALIAAGFALLLLLGRRVPRDSGETASRETKSRLARFLDVLLIGAWFGLVTGAAHSSLALIDRYVRNRFLMASSHMFWMTPVADALIFGGLA